MTGQEIIAEIRRLLYEATADLWTDADILAHANAEIRLLPAKGIYLEEIHTTTKVLNQQDYTLPTGTFKVEVLEENLGTSSDPDWKEMRGYDFYAGAIWLANPANDTRSMRAWISKAFTAIANDTTESDVPETKIDIVIYGAAIRAYQQLIGYLVDAKNYDSIIKPDGITMNAVRGWITELEAHQKRMLNTIRGVPKPRSINLVD